MNVYRHSGRMPLLGIPLTVVFGLVTAAALGFVYSYIIVYDPIIYINALCTVGFGFAIGAAVAKGARWGKIRNPVLAGAYGLVFGVAGLYFAWVADLWARSGDPFDLAAFEPRVLTAYIAWFYENGLWSIDNHGNAGAPVSGIALGIVWLVEAGVTVGFSTAMAYRSVADLPFCEACNEWTKRNRDAALIRLTPAVRQRLPNGDLSVLDESIRATGSENLYVQLDLYCCPKCDESILLTARELTVGVDKKGNRTTKAKIMLKHLIVDAADVPRILAAGNRTSLPEPPPQPT